MKNLKVLSFVLLFGVLVIAGCEKTNNPEKVSCEGDDVCPVEQTVETPSIEIVESPSVIVEANDEEGNLNGDKGNLEGDLDSYEGGQDGIVLDSDVVSDEPMMRKMLVDENVTAEEIEQDMVNTCANAGGTWDDGACTLEDGTVIAF